MHLPFVSSVLDHISAWWKAWDARATVKYAVDTINSFGLNKDHLEAVASEVIAISTNKDFTGIGKAGKVAEVIDTWTGSQALPAPAMENLHLVISLVHLIAKLTGKI